MKVFLSWSGDKSKAVALLLEEWIQCLLQAAEPWISTNIDSGAMWLSEINEQLAAVKVGVICITQENKEKPWILFEAGALAKGLPSSRVCTLLIDLQNNDIKQPLAQFNHTDGSKEGIRKLITTINSALDKSLPLNILEKVFELHWPVFENTLKKIQEKYNTQTNPNQEQQSKEADILIEILNSVRSYESRLTHLEGKKEIRLDMVKPIDIEMKKFIRLMIRHQESDETMLRQMVRRFPEVSLAYIVDLIKEQRDNLRNDNNSSSNS